MASKYGDIVTRVVEDGDIVRIDPGALVQIFTADTDTLITEVNADANGFFEVAILAAGEYDIKVAGRKVRTISHIPSDHTYPPTRSFQFFVSGAISGDQEEVNTVSVFGVNEAGTIEGIRVNAQYVSATGDVTVHVLKGVVNGASAMTMVSNSEWNHRIYPAAEKFRYFHGDDVPGIELSANDAITIALDYAAAGVEGINVEVIYRPAT